MNALLKFFSRRTYCLALFTNNTVLLQVSILPRIDLLGRTKKEGLLHSCQFFQQSVPLLFSCPLLSGFCSKSALPGHHQIRCFFTALSEPGASTGQDYKSYKTFFCVAKNKYRGQKQSIYIFFSFLFLFFSQIFVWKGSNFFFLGGGINYLDNLQHQGDLVRIVKSLQSSPEGQIIPR